MTLALNPPGAHVPMVGASAAISGLVGGYLLLYPGSSMCRCVGLGFLYRCFRVRASSYLALWVLLQFVYALTSPFIAVWAHLGGFFTGLALTYLLADRGRVRELREAIAGGRVRGLPPRRDELAGGSLGPLARGAVVVAAAVTALLILASTVLVVAGPRGYYVVYLRYGVEFTCRGNVCSCYEGFLGATYNITRSPPATLEDVVVPQASPWCPGDVVLKPVAVYNLYRAPLIAVPVAAVAVALLVVTVHTMVRGYREVEVV